MWAPFAQPFAQPFAGPGLAPFHAAPLAAPFHAAPFHAAPLYSAAPPQVMRPAQAYPPYVLPAAGRGPVVYRSAASQFGRPPVMYSTTYTQPPNRSASNSPARSGREYADFAFKVATPEQDVADHWETVHSTLEPGAPVEADPFVGLFLSKCDEKHWGPYEGFLRALHAVASGMVPVSAGARCPGLDRHCFAYACFLASEYFGTDELFQHEAAAAARLELDADFAAIGSEHVVEDSFVQHFVAKHASQLGSAQPQYETFLRACFQVGCTMCQAECLDQQAFRYCGLLAGEFCFPGYAPQDSLGLAPR